MNREEVLKETIRYYSENPNSRNVERTYRETDGMLTGISCKYAPLHPATDGCAVGRLLPLQLAKRLDAIEGNSTVAVDEVFEKLPQEIQNLGKYFLLDLQRLHDQDSYWNPEGGLSMEGEMFVNEIKGRILRNSYK